MDEDLVVCEVCDVVLEEDERCYRYLGDDEKWFCEEMTDAVEVHTFCEVHAPDCVDED